jgi:hypothetical protein
MGSGEGMVACKTVAGVKETKGRKKGKSYKNRTTILTEHKKQKARLNRRALAVIEAL